MKKPRTYKRWYDSDARLQEFIHLLEQLTPNHQSIFACLIYEFPEQMLEKQKVALFMEEFSLGKVKGLLKSYRKHRWYDQNPLTRRAMNMLYALSGPNRILVVQNLMLPLKLTIAYERLCLEQKKAPVEETWVFEMLETFFQLGSQQTRRIYKELLDNRKPVKLRSLAG